MSYGATSVKATSERAFESDKLASLLAFIRIARHYFPFSAPNPFGALFHITLLRAERRGRFPRGREVLRASNGAHSASSASGVTDHAHKKCSPLKANFCERGRQLTSEKGIRDDIVRKRSCDATGIPSEKRATFVCLLSIPLPGHLPREIESIASGSASGQQASFVHDMRTRIFFSAEVSDVQCNGESESSLGPSRHFLTPKLKVSGNDEGKKFHCLNDASA